MKTPNLIIILLLAFSLSAQGGDADTADMTTYLPFVFDADLTMRSGVENIISTHSILARAEDRVVGTQWFDESNSSNKAGGMALRFAKWTFLDLPVDYFQAVFAHEYFGHGARYREFDVENVDYGYDPPPPYGDGGGHATAGIDIRTVSEHELISVMSGGIEVQQVLNRNLAQRWMARGDIHYREASQYWWTFQIDFDYINSTKDFYPEGAEAKDLYVYIQWLNEVNGYDDPADYLMDVDDVKSKYVLNAIDPFLLYSVFTQVKTYLYDGNITNRFPTIELGKVEYLPALHTSLTPFGLQYHLLNYLRFSNRVALVDLRLGDQTFHDSWGGVGVRVVNLFEGERFSIDADLNVWKQPEMVVGPDPGTVKGGDIGTAISARGYYELSDTQKSVAAVLELGYKSAGFLDGYVLDSSPIIMAGLAWRY